MKRLKSFVIGLLTGTVPFLSACAVEAGNPDPTAGKTGGKSGASTGLISIQLTDAPIDHAKHVYLNLETLSLLPLAADGSDANPISVPLANSGQVDALALQGDNSLSLATAQALASGSYGAVILGISSGTVVTADDQQIALPLTNAANQVVIAQQFGLQSDETLSLLVDLDLRRSIVSTQSGSGTTLSFAPVGNLNVAGQQGQIVATVADTTLTEVCAYLFLQTPNPKEGALNAPLTPPAPHTPPGGPGAAPPPKSVTAQPPTTIAPGKTFNPQTDGATCGNAFAVATISAGAFTLDPLWPGQYQLEFYNAAGVLSTSSVPPVNIVAGQTVNLKVPAGAPAPPPAPKPTPAGPAAAP